MEYLTELMLKSYFTAEVCIGKFLEEREKLFSAYARIFLLPKEEAERLYCLISDERVAEIASEADYHRYSRLKRYKMMISREDTSDPVCEELISLKGAAISAAMEGGLLKDVNEVESDASQRITLAARDGSIRGLVILGILQTEGLLVCRDVKGGIGRLQKAADWNSIEGLLAMLYYTKEHDEYLSRLKSCLKRAGRLDAFERVGKFYGACVEHSTEDRLLEKTFHLGVVKRDTYNKSYARLIYSGILSERDKESLLLSSDQTPFYEACALPLKLDSREADFHPEAMGGRLGEDVCKELEGALRNVDLRRMPAYRPLLFTTDCKYLQEMYADAIGGSFGGAHIERIEVGALDEYDFEPSKNHIFVRSCDEDAMNIYFIFMRGECGQRAFEEVKNFLGSAMRRNFRLNRPSVTIDLANILPIVFCDRQNAERLKSCCDQKVIPDPSRAEKQKITEHILREKKALYGVKNFSIAENCLEELLTLSVDGIEQILNGAILENRFKDTVFTKESLEAYVKRFESEGYHFGFGGRVA